MKTTSGTVTQRRSVVKQVQGNQSCDPDYPPKLLSWLTARSGVPISVGQGLWQQACQEVGKDSVPGSRDFFAAAIDRLIELIENESTRRDLASFGFRPWARYHAGLLSVSTHLILSCYQLQHRHMRTPPTLRWSPFFPHHLSSNSQFLK